MACIKHDFEKDAADQLPRCVHCGRKEDDIRYIIAVGNAFDGIKLIGPFDTADEACWHGEGLEGHPEWVLTNLERP